MTNAEKFKEVFGMRHDSYVSRKDKRDTKLINTQTFWQSEYQEPKQNIFDYLTATGQGMIEGEKIANDEWVKAINAIKDDFKGQAKRQKEKEERRSDGKVVEIFFGTKHILRTITKHTKELM